MLPWPAAVAQDVRIRAAGLLQGVRQDGQVLEAATVIDGLGNVDDGPVVPP
jgi:hypothetical protein